MLNEPLVMRDGANPDVQGAFLAEAFERGDVAFDDGSDAPDRDAVIASMTTADATAMRAWMRERVGLPQNSIMAIAEAIGAFCATHRKRLRFTPNFEKWRAAQEAAMGGSKC